jgi:glycerophosphoryl diester phosphodiesterase
VLGAILGAAALGGGVAGCAGGTPATVTHPVPRPATHPATVTASGISGALVRPAEAEGGAAAVPGEARHCDGPQLIAHRGETGDGANLPENTWQSELAAATEGATYLNMDVRWTSDGVPVALHDATVNRTTSEQQPDMPVTRLTAQQYTALDARYYASDTSRGLIDPAVHPDTLAEVLGKIAPTGKPIVLQMEADPYQPDQAGATPHQDFESLARVIEQSGYADKVIVAGWTLEDLRAFHTLAPGVPLAYLFESIGATNYPSGAELLATDTHILYMDYRGITAAETSAWHAQGVQVWAWTPADRVQWERLHADGVDAIATNWTSFYVRWAIPCSADSSD